MKSVIFGSKTFNSSQDWAADPNLMLLAINEETIAKLNKGLNFIVENKFDSIGITSPNEYKFYDQVEPFEDTQIDFEGKKYIEFSGEYPDMHSDCGIVIDSHGYVTVTVGAIHTDDTLQIPLGKLDELKAKFI